MLFGVSVLLTSPLLALVLLLVGCAPPPAVPTVATPVDDSYRFRPPAHVRGCEVGDTSPGCVRYRAIADRRRPDAEELTIAAVDAMRDLCREGIYDACDQGLLLRDICSEQQPLVEAGCLHLADHRALLAPEPIWVDAEPPRHAQGCFVLEPGRPGREAVVPGAVHCYGRHRVAFAAPGLAPDAALIRWLGQRHLVRVGRAVRARELVRWSLVGADPHPDVIRLPEHFGLLSPALHVVPLQLLAYHTALARNTDVDKPRNLAKSVTVE